MVIEREVGSMIIEILHLEEVVAEDIDPEEPLFGDGLGLDSIDALELSLAISTRYGIQITTENTDVSQVFSSLRSLTEFIENHRKD
jgi:acyl carrier protein|tara:strand:- start:261 stop:518 length:258 start_codon:yes stop_codon:yes gene_type:complete